MQWLDCLQSSPKRLLVGIASYHGLPNPRDTAKDRLIQDLAAYLSNPARLTAALAQLSLPEMRALHTLAVSGGQAPWLDFRAAFGDIRPYLTRTYAGPPHPWRVPESIAESLVYQGLIFLLVPGTPGNASPLVMLPDELLQRLRPPEPITVPELPLPAPNAYEPTSIVLDLALFLGYLQANEVHPLHGRWLSLRHCRNLASCFSVPGLDPDTHSELRSGRLAFVHFLAEALDLLQPTAGRLKPSAAAMAWLQQPFSIQLQQLRNAWLSPAEPHRQLRRRYRLPGHALRDPQALAERAIQLLAAFPTGSPITVEALLQSPHLAADSFLPWWERETTDRPADLLHALLAGPLSWLGILADLPSDAPGRAWRRTAWGEWLLGIRQPEPPTPPREPLSLLPHLALNVSPSAFPDAILAVAPWTELFPGPELRLTPASVATALARGAELPDLLVTLAAHSAPLLQPSQLADLMDWAERAAVVRLRPALLLECVPASTLDTLHSDRRMRPFLSHRLSAGAALLRTDQPDRLSHLLQQRGLTVDLSPLLPDPKQSLDQALASGDATWLAVAFQVYTALARRLPLLAAPPAAALESLRPALSPAQWAVVETATAQAIAAVEAALDDPPPDPPTHARDDLVDRLTAAIHDGQTLALRYWSPWTQETTDRTVQPHHIEWRGDHPYLIAFCQLRQQDRSFRLDRILSLYPYPTI